MNLYNSAVSAESASRRFQVLLAIASGPRHGSDISREVAAQTGGRLRLWPVMLYGLLDELAADGLIREATGRDRPPGQSERRRYFVLTARGRRTLADEAARLADLARTAKAALARPSR